MNSSGTSTLQKPTLPKTETVELKPKTVESVQPDAAPVEERKERKEKKEEKSERAAKPLGGGIKRGFNIRGADKPEAIETVEESRRTMRSEKFGPEAAKGAWGSYLDHLKEEKRKVEYNAFATGKMEVRPDSKLLFKFSSLTLLNEFNEHREEILLFLRDRLKNDSVLMLTELDVSEEKKYVKSQQELFDEMCRRNPLLRKMKEDLGLNIDK